MDKIIELLRKLQVLADQGEQNEAANAQHKIDMLCAKYNVSIDDLQNEERRKHYYTIHDPLDLKLLLQIVKQTDESAKMYTPPDELIEEFNLPGNVIVECTATDFILIDQKFNHYSRLLSEEVGIFFRAFCLANNLLIKKPSDKKADDLSKEQIDRIRRSQNMARNVKVEDLKKQLTN